MRLSFSLRFDSYYVVFSLFMHVFIVFVFVEETILNPDKMSNCLKHCVIHLNIESLFHKMHTTFPLKRPNI
jgi:hypothetical protein